MHSLLKSSRILLICLFLRISATAQTSSIVDGTVPLGIGPAASYPLSGFEHYDPFSGASNVAFPLYHVRRPGRSRVRPGLELSTNLGTAQG